MIEVTREGVLPDTKPYAGKCARCGTEIRCMQGDGKLRYQGQLDPQVLTVFCPLRGCGESIDCLPVRGERRV